MYSNIFPSVHVRQTSALNFVSCVMGQRWIEAMCTSLYAYVVEFLHLSARYPCRKCLSERENTGGSH